jgi:hypothetical protein
MLESTQRRVRREFLLTNDHFGVTTSSQVDIFQYDEKERFPLHFWGRKG